MRVPRGRTGRVGVLCRSWPQSVATFAVDPALSPARSASAGEASAPSGAAQPTVAADVVVQAKKPGGSAFRMVGMAIRDASDAYSRKYRNTIKRT